MHAFCAVEGNIPSMFNLFYGMQALDYTEVTSRGVSRTSSQLFYYLSCQVCAAIAPEPIRSPARVGNPLISRGYSCSYMGYILIAQKWLGWEKSGCKMWDWNLPPLTCPLLAKRL